MWDKTEVKEKTSKCGEKGKINGELILYFVHCSHNAGVPLSRY
jgi:hypothetical protein